MEKADFTPKPEKPLSNYREEPIAFNASLTPKNAAKFLAILSFNFPKLWDGVDRETLAVMFWQSFRNLTESQVARGVEKFVLTHRDVYPGTNVMAYIREYAFNFDALPTAADAWLSVRTAISRHGHGKPPEFKSEIVADTVRAFGWIELCNSTNSDAARAHFTRMFDEKLERFKQRARNGETFSGGKNVERQG